MEPRIQFASEIASESLGNIACRSKEEHEKPKCSSGLQDLDDRIVGFRPGELIVVGGRPWMGKTAFAIQCALHSALNKATSVGYLSVSTPAEILGVRMLCSLADISSRKATLGGLEPEDHSKLADAAAKLEAGKIAIVDGFDDGPEQLDALVSRMMDETRMDLLIVDDLQGLGHGVSNSRGDLETVWSGVGVRLKRLAKAHQIPVILLASVSYKKTEFRKNKRPIITDLHGVSGLEPAADTVLLLYRESYYHPEKKEAEGFAEMTIAKNRSGWILGKVGLFFDNEKGIIKDLSRASWPEEF